jgi:hypothetical protein
MDSIGISKGPALRRRQPSCSTSSPIATMHPPHPLPKPHPRSLLRHGLAAALLGLLASLAACGGGGGKDSAGPDPVTQTLSVSVSGTGAVTSSSGTIQCGNGGTACSTNIPTNTDITLTATPAAGHALQAWGGACSGSAATCTVGMKEARQVTASFVAVPTRHKVTVSTSGLGTVTSQPAGILCGRTCILELDAGTQVVLTATPDDGQRLESWGGACAGTSGNRCTLTMSEARTVSASFVAQTANLALSLTVSGQGTVNSQPVGLSCSGGNSGNCSASFAPGTQVVLSAVPAQGQVLQAWGGACSGSAGSCTVGMSEARQVSAQFVAASAPVRAWGAAALLENSNDFNVADTNTFADTLALTAIDSAGNALVLWEQSDGTPGGSTRKVFSRRYVAEQGWQAPVVVPGLSTSSSSVDLVTGVLLMDDAGNATWIRHNFETRRFSATASWSATAFLPANSSGGTLGDAKIDASGQVHLLGVGGNVLYSRLAAGSSQWAAWTNISQTSETTRSPHLALSSGGTMMAVWRERNAGDANDSMKAARFSGGSWQAPVRIEELFTPVRDSAPRVVMDANGNAMAAWHQANSLFVNRFSAASNSWGSATEIDAGQVESTFNARIRLAMAPDGRAVLAWDSGIFAVKALSVTAAGGLGAPSQVNSYSAGHFLGIDRDGRALLVYRAPTQWPNPTDATQNLYVRELPASGVWSAQALLETGAGEVKAGVPCAMNAAGAAVCAWAQNDVANSTARNSLWVNLRR